MFKLSKMKNLKKLLKRDFFFSTAEPLNYFIPNKKLSFDSKTKKLTIYKYEKKDKEIICNIIGHLIPITLTTILVKSKLSKINKLITLIQD